MIYWIPSSLQFKKVLSWSNFLIRPINDQSTLASRIGLTNLWVKGSIFRRFWSNLWLNPSAREEKKSLFLFGFSRSRDFFGQKFLVDWKASSKHYPLQHFDFAVIARCREKTKGKSSPWYQYHVARRRVKFCSFKIKYPIYRWSRW